MIIKQALSKGPPHGFLNSTRGKICVLTGRKRSKLDVYTLQSQDSLSRQRAGNDIQARYFPVTGMQALSVSRATAMCPVINAVQKRIHGVA